MVCEEGSHRLGPPSKKSLKEGGDTPHPPSFLGWVERAWDLETRWVYREPGKARFMSLQWPRSDHCCSCLVPVPKTPKDSTWRPT